MSFQRWVITPMTLQNSKPRFGGVFCYDACATKEASWIGKLYLSHVKNQLVC